MELKETLYVTNRKDWRSWLAKHHKNKKEIWLIYYKKHSGKPRIPYNDAVDEALCYGWIDSIVKKVDEERTAQRFTPRKEKSSWSEMNKERARRLIKAKKMTTAGLAKVTVNLDEKFVVPKDILRELKKDNLVWKNFQKFPLSYKRIRIGYIDGSRSQPDEFQKRLNYFIKKTKQNKQFGMVK